MSYQTFKNKWLGKATDYDGVYGYQCVDLIKRYLAEEFGLKPGAWGDAVDYWNKTNSGVLTKFNKVNGSDAKQGDIVVLKGLNGNPYGHIGIATGGINGKQVEILEQNGSSGNGKGQGGDKIRTRYVDRSRVAGLLRPKSSAPSNMPAVGSKIQLIPKDTRTTFKAGTTTKAGSINVKDNTYVYQVRGYDSKYPGRIIINSASAGGNGVALALYYTDGKLIPGWKRV